MSILIFGASGMLGHKLCQQLSPDFEVFATLRSDFLTVERFGIFSPSSIISEVEVNDLDSVRRAIETAKPAVVINAIGLIKQLPEASDVIKTVSTNSIFPHRLAELSSEYGFRLIGISTDCVFSGEKGNYTETDTPDANDLYGRSKILGEVKTGNSVTIRTSMIGRELSTAHSLIEWFLSQRRSRVNGFAKSIYSGFTTTELADVIKLILTKPDLNGLYHVSSDPISKLDLLTLLNQYFDADVEITPSDDMALDRSLDSSRFRTLTGYKPPTWEEMITRFAADTTPYESFR